LSRYLAEAAGSIHLLYSALCDPNLPLHCVWGDDGAALDGVERDVGIHGHPSGVTSNSVVRPDGKRIVYEQSFIDICVECPHCVPSLIDRYFFHILHV
jgi:hypothetical protein